MSKTAPHAGTGGKNKKRRPKPATPASLARAAETYVARFSATEAMLHAVLVRRVRRSERLFGADPEPLLAAVDDICARMTQSGAVNDAAYAAARARTLFERGTAPFVIRRRLAAKGVAAGLAAEAAEEASGGGPEAELTACARLARRRGLGPFRQSGQRTANRDKDLAALARAGFGYGAAQTVVDAENSSDLPLERPKKPG
ncbi:MAG: RecX family transcriptional regulator [Rhodospirillales bacterium]